MDKLKLLILSLIILLGLQAAAQISREKISNHVSDSTGFTTIREITIVGNDKTKDYIITRELSFNQGDTLANHQLEKELQRSRNNVYNTNLVLEELLPSCQLCMLEIKNFSWFMNRTRAASVNSKKKQNI